MNKADLIKSLAKEKGVIKAQASQVVEPFFGERNTKATLVEIQKREH